MSPYSWLTLTYEKQIPECFGYGAGVQDAKDASWVVYAEISRYFGVDKPALKEPGRLCYLEPEFLANGRSEKIGISAAYNLVRVDRTRGAEAAALFLGMSRQEIRALSLYSVKYPDISVQDAKRRANELAPQAVNVLARP